MGQDWLSNSEILAGLVIKGKKSLNQVRPELFAEPYDEIIKLMKDGHQDIDYLIQNVGLAPIQAATDSVENLNGLSDADWVSIVEQSRALYASAQKMKRYIKKMEAGEAPNWAEVVGMARDADTSKSEFVSLADVSDEDTMPFIKTGWKPWDRHLMGVPEAGMVILAGHPGVGKTDALAKVISCFVLKHKDKNAGVFSLEMINNEIAGRFRKLKLLSPEDEKRVLLYDGSGTIEEIINQAAKIDNVGIVAIDFADLMVRGEVSEPQMTNIYSTTARAAKDLHIPIFLLSQLNGQYTGGIPRPYHIRYTRQAEAMAWMIVMLWRPAEDYYEKQDDTSLPFPIRQNAGYLFTWKVRGGFLAHLDESPGVFAVDYTGSTGWGDTSRWYSLRKSAV